MEQRFTFDEIADLYNERRPGYPEELVDDLLFLSEAPYEASILEIGCGTGQLTRSIARRGHRLLCLEPGHNLARLATLNLARFKSVQIREETFEAWSPEKSFDVVVAAQSFHWVPPEVRFKKAAACLSPHGALAIVGNVPIGSGTVVEEAIQNAYLTFSPSLHGTCPTRWYASDGELRDLFSDSNEFMRVESRRYPWRQAYRAEEYVQLLSTYSDHRLLSAASREALFRSIREAIESNGGSITIGYEAHLHVGRRAA